MQVISKLDISIEETRPICDLHGICGDLGDIVLVSELDGGRETLEANEMSTPHVGDY